MCQQLVFLLAAVVALFASQSPAQSPIGSSQWNKAHKTDSAAPAHLAAQRDHALTVLGALFPQAAELKDPILRIKLQAQIADLQWQHDEARARRHLVEAFESIDKIEEKAAEANRPELTRVSTKFRLRKEVLQVVSRRDSKLADSLLSSLTRETEEVKAGSPTDRSMQQVDLADALARTHPAFAAQLLRDSMAYGLDLHWATALLQLRARDPAAAQEVFRQALAFLQADFPARYLRTMDLAMYVLLDRVLWAERSGAYPKTTTIPEDAQRIRERREYLATAYPVIVAEVNKLVTGQEVPEAQRVYQLLPLYDKYLPQTAAELRKALVRFPEAHLLRGTSMRGLDEPETTSELLRRAEVMPEGLERDRIYMRAAQAMESQGDPEAGLRIACKVVNKRMRSHIVGDIRRVWLTKALTRDDVDTALRYAREEDEATLRTVNFSLIISHLRQKKDRRRATDMLNELEYWLSANPEAARNPHGLLTFAGIASQWDVQRGIGAMRKAIKAINETALVSPANMRPVKPWAEERPLYLETLPFRPGLARLARADFEWALALAKTIEKPEASVMAQLVVCEGVLGMKAEEEDGKVKAAKQPGSLVAPQ